MSNDKIEIIYNAKPSLILGDSKVTNLVIDIKDSGLQTLNVGGIFPFIGSVPSTDLFKEQLSLDEQGYILTDSHLRTSVRGVYAVGDVRVSDFKQVVSACYEGALAGHMCRVDENGK